MTTSDINKIMAEDLESRNKIIHNIKENYFVEAGAVKNPSSSSFCSTSFGNANPTFVLNA